MTEAEAKQFDEAVSETRKLRARLYDPAVSWYRGHQFIPFLMFRGSGALTLLLSAALPAVALTHFGTRSVIAIMSTAIAALSGLGSFYKWERTWRGRRLSVDAFQQLWEKCELEMLRARELPTQKECIAHVYDATDSFIVNFRTILSGEQEAFFSGLQFPSNERTSKG